MKRNNLPAVMVSGWLAIFIAGCATDSPRQVSLPIVPDSVKVPETEVLSFAANAQGFQIYECRAGKDGQYEWVFNAPEADLFDGRGRKIGRHYGGPTWEANDGSKVVGEVKGREPSTDTNA